MMSIGIVLIASSVFIQTDWLCVVLAILGATLVWGSTELKEQAVRSEIGWYSFNANKIPPPFVEIIKKWKAPHL